jgi:hypothetical protein
MKILELLINLAELGVLVYLAVLLTKDIRKK